MGRRGLALLGASIVLATLLGSGAAAAEEPSEVPVVPVREREVWFRDAWVGRIHAGVAADQTLGEITAGYSGRRR